MKKSLNDSLREEFKGILEKDENKNLTVSKKLDMTIINGAFEKLLSSDSFYGDEPEDIDRARSEFEIYIINSLKTKQH